MIEPIEVQPKEPAPFWVTPEANASTSNAEVAQSSKQDSTLQTEKVERVANQKLSPSYAQDLEWLKWLVKDQKWFDQWVQEHAQEVDREVALERYFVAFRKRWERAREAFDDEIKRLNIKKSASTVPGFIAQRIDASSRREIAVTRLFFVQRVSREQGLLERTTHRAAWFKGSHHGV
jgi:hypothetical protein